jgi:hypothetical protein
MGLAITRKFATVAVNRIIKKRRKTKLNLVELFSDGSADNSSIESSDISNDDRSEGFRSSVRSNHIP